jgi:hypothetical protein
MTTPIEQLSFIPGKLAATGVNPDKTITKTSLGNWSSRVIDVRDYGADPTASVDSTDAIQAAFNDAFGLSIFQGSIASGTATTAILTVSAITARPTILGPIVAGMVLNFPNVPLNPPNFVQPARIIIAAFGTGGTTGTGGVGTYSLSFSSLSPGTFPTIPAQPMLLCQSSQQGFKSRPVCLGTGNYLIYYPLYIVSVIGAHVYGDGNGACQLLYLGDGTQKNIFINAGFPPNNNWTPILALDGVLYSKIDGISLTAYPGTQAEQGSVPFVITFTGSVAGNVLTVASGLVGNIVAGMIVSYTGSPAGLTILAFGTSGTTGTGGIGSYALSSSPGTAGLQPMQCNSITPLMTGIMAYQSSVTGTTSAIVFENINVGNCYAGIAGVQGLGNVENCILINVGLNTCGLRGVWLTNQNVLNWQVYGGGAQGCGWLTTFVPGVGGEYGAAYYCPAASIGCLYGISCTGNNWDVVGGYQCHVAGGSFEGQPSFHGVLTWSSASGGTAKIVTDYPHKLKFDQPIAIYRLDAGTPASYEGRVTGHIVDANTVTYPLANPGGSGGALMSPTNAGTIACTGNAMSLDGLGFRGGDTDCYLPIYCEGGSVSVNGCNIAAAHSGITGTIAYLVNGHVSFNECLFSNWPNASFKSAGGSELYVRGSIYINPPTAPFSQFSGGVVREYDRTLGTTVAALPTAAAILQGLQGSVTDGAASLAWGATVTGGGSTFYNVVCNGSAWTVSGK